MDKLSKQKLKRDMLEITDLMNQMNLTDIYRTFYPNTKNSKNFLLNQLYTQTQSKFQYIQEN